VLPPAAYSPRMYQYDPLDQAFVDQRVAEFRDQTRRYLAGELSEDEFRGLRLRNGLYIQRHAPMLRIAIPYGLLSSRQLRKLGAIARDFDRGFGHFTTRQNLQLNWPRLEAVPDILEQLASVQMHAIQTSGNCIRNVTADHMAGIAVDEVDDPRPYCEITCIRNSPTCPASSRSRSPARPRIAPPPRCTTWACICGAMSEARSVSRYWWGVAWAAPR